MSGRGPAGGTLVARTTAQRRGEGRSIVALLPNLAERDGYAVEQLGFPRRILQVIAAGDQAEDQNQGDWQQQKSTRPQKMLR